MCREGTLMEFWYKYTFFRHNENQYKAPKMAKIRLAYIPAVSPLG